MISTDTKNINNVKNEKKIRVVYVVTFTTQIVIR